MKICSANIPVCAVKQGCLTYIFEGASMLYIFSGLPGTGKSTLARQLAEERQAVYLRIDTIEQALRDVDVWDNGPAGYVAAYGLAADNLRLGLAVVADSVNPLAVTRRAWRQVAEQAGVPFVEIEVVCSDEGEHRRRVESRRSDIVGHILPNWAQVRGHDYQPWEEEHIVIDTADQTPAESVEQLQHLLRQVES
jgi:predicted kinase